MPRFSCRSRKASSAVAAGRHTPKDGSGVPIAATTKSDRSRTRSLESSCRRKCRNSSSAPRRIAVSSASSGRGRSSSNRRHVPKARSRGADVAAVAVDQAADRRPHPASRSRNSRKRSLRVRNRVSRKSRKKRVRPAAMDGVGDFVGAAAVAATGQSRPPRASALDLSDRLRSRHLGALRPIQLQMSRGTFGETLAANAVTV